MSRRTRLLLALALALPSAAEAQFVTRPRTGLGISAGVAQFDMSGTGTAPFGALRLEYELLPWLVADGALGLFRPNEQFGVQRTYLVPEAQLQGQMTFNRVRPYLGLGVGMLRSVRGGERNYEIFSGAAGARVSLANEVDVRAELRVTGEDATLAQWTLGLARRL